MRTLLRQLMRLKTAWLIAAFFALGWLATVAPALGTATQTAAQPLVLTLGALDGPRRPSDAALRQAVATSGERAALLARDNARLRQQLRLLAPRALRQAAGELPPVLDAAVLGVQDLSAWRQSLAIARGSADGVRLGMPVLWGRTLIGRIAAVGPGTSRVQLVADPGYPGVKVLVLPADRTLPPEDELDGFPHGLAVGTLSRTLGVALEHVELTARVSPGDWVFTSNQSVIVPGGLVVGRVVSVERSRDPRFARVAVRPWANPRRLERVAVLLMRPKLDLVPPAPR